MQNISYLSAKVNSICKKHSRQSRVRYEKWKETTKIMISSRGKIRKHLEVFLYGTPIERVDTFLDSRIVVKFENTFQSTMQKFVEKAEKALPELAVYSGKIELEAKNTTTSLDAFTKPVLLYDIELWGYEKVEQTKVFDWNFLRNFS